MKPEPARPRSQRRIDALEKLRSEVDLWVASADEAGRAYLVALGTPGTARPCPVRPRPVTSSQDLSRPATSRDLVAATAPAAVAAGAGP